MRADVVTFWHGPLDPLRQLCLRSQVAAGHRVTVYSFAPLENLPDGVRHADAEAILPMAFAQRLRPIPSDGAWCDVTTVQFADFFRMRLMALGAGLWLDSDVLLLKAIEIDLAKPCFAWEHPRQLGNSVLYLPREDPIVADFTALMRQQELTPDWLAFRHRLIFAIRKLRGMKRLSDVRVAIYGPAALTALARRHGELHHAWPEKSFYAVHAEPKLFFEPWDFQALLEDPGVTGFHISPKKQGHRPPVAGSLHAWAANRFRA